MPIREESFRIGCGRYIQGNGYISKCGEEICRVGRVPLIIGDDITLGLTEKKIIDAVGACCEKYKIIAHNGTCNETDAKSLAELATSNNFDVIVGVGGGVIMDFAKLCAYFAKLPIINIPTSSATCASYAPLSVRYTVEGRTVGSKHYENEVNAVIVDSEIVGSQPIRLLLSGVFDALAKFVEIKQRFKGDIDGEYPMGLDYAYTMAEHSYRVLNEKIVKCISDMKKGDITDDVEKVIFTAIAATGVISGIARGSNQCAIAHKFYETTRTLFHESARPYLHGEIVGVGLLLQNYFNGEEKNNEKLLKLMKDHGMPYRVEDIGVEKNDKIFEEYYNMICKSSAIDDSSADECRRFRSALEYLWNIE